MKFKMRFLLATGAAALVLLAGCSSPVKLDETPVESRTPTPVTRSTTPTPKTPADPTPSAQSQVATVDLARSRPADSADIAADKLARVIYFDFDSFVVKDEFKAVVEGHARALAAAKSRHMVVEGHTDERGGSEYNLALGQRRADAVVKSLSLLGVTERQLEAVSFGKEKPAAEGHDEAAWTRNRRAELKDR
jgi:peptidoglycan-associated lipoprotein